MKNYFDASEILALQSLDDLPSERGVFRYFVFGNPIHHSKSPEMHHAALDGLKMNESYGRIKLDEYEVKPVLKHLQSLGCKGVNVTVPHKFEAFKACDQLGECAAEFGAVNTVEFLPNGELKGYNTDGGGFVKAVEQDFDTNIQNLTIAVIGAGGGAGTAISQACANHQVKRLLLANRSTDKIEVLKERIQAKHPELEIETVAIQELTSHAWFADINVFANATSLGLKVDDPLPFDASQLSSKQAVYDTIYNPDPTALLAEAKAQGAQTSNGKSMLAWQGALAFEIWNNTLPNVRLMYQAIG